MSIKSISVGNQTEDKKKKKEKQQDPSSFSSALDENKEKHLFNQIFWIVGIALAFAISIIIGLHDFDYPRIIDDTGGIVDDPGGIYSSDDDHQLFSPQIFSSSSNSNLNWTLQSFSQSILDGYDGCDHLRGNITQISNFLADLIIQQNKDLYNEIALSVSESESSENKNKPKVESSGDSGKNTATSTTSREDGFGTNNQEKNVEEADIIKSDGTNVFAAYGDVLVVWDAKSGKKLSWTVMPPDTKRASSKPKISALLLDNENHRLVALVYGYTPNTHSRSSFSFDDEYPALSNYGTLRAIVFDIRPEVMPMDGTGELFFLKIHDLQGNFRTARSIGPYVQIVTMSNVNYHSWTSKLNRRREEFRSLSTDEYAWQAQNIVPELVEEFVEKLMIELGIHDSRSTTCNHIVGLSSFLTGDNFTDISYGLPWTLDNGIANGYAQVTTLDLSADQNTVDLSSPHSFTGVFVPGAFERQVYAQVYASENYFVLASQGYSQDTNITTSLVSYNGAWAGWIESTMFINFQLSTDGTAPAKAHSVGQVTGWFFNQFSMDEHNGHLRVATTIRRREGCISVKMNTSIDGRSYESCAAWGNIRDTTNQITVLEYPKPIKADDEALMNMNKGTNKPSIMNVVGFLGRLGKPEETIFACRFMGDRAFVVTFRLTDPFYAIDMSDPTMPYVAGELEIPGFSSYLHPVDDGDNSDLIVAVGEDVDQGCALGVQIALFDVSNMSMPLQVDVHKIESPLNQRWNSEVQWEHKAFRLLSQMKKILLPVSHSCGSTQSQCTDFDGFQIFGFNRTNIWYEFSVSHASSSSLSSQSQCWYGAYMQSRSLVFGGNMTSIKGHSVISTDLVTRKERWVLELDEDLKGTDCSSYWVD